MALSDRGGLSFVRRMEAAKRQARIDRNKGRHIGAPPKGCSMRRELSADEYTFADHARLALDRWCADVREIVNDYQAAVLNGPTWEDDCEIPF